MVARSYLQIPTLPLFARALTIRDHALMLPVHLAEPVNRLRAVIRAAIADVWGPDHVPEDADGFRPHVSLAYSNAAGPAEPIIQRLGAHRQRRDPPGPHRRAPAHEIMRGTHHARVSPAVQRERSVVLSVLRVAECSPSLPQAVVIDKLIGSLGVANYPKREAGKAKGQLCGRFLMPSLPTTSTLSARFRCRKATGESRSALTRPTCLPG